MEVLQSDAGVWWNLFGEVGVLGIEKGLDTKIFDKDGSFLYSRRFLDRF